MTNPRIIKVSDYTDRDIICIDCGTTFTWTAPEQAFYASNLRKPKSCLPNPSASAGSKRH